jgi:predicted nuclease of predicted toxin-antitoxin system
MRLLIDANVPRQVAVALTEAGHEVDTSILKRPGLDDRSVIEHVQATATILITQDRDFGELVFRQGARCQGIVFLRLAGLDNHRKAALVVAVIAQHSARLAGTFTVIDAGQVRFRPLPQP